MNRNNNTKTAFQLNLFFFPPFSCALRVLIKGNSIPSLEREPVADDNNTATTSDPAAAKRKKKKKVFPFSPSLCCVQIEIVKFRSCAARRAATRKLSVSFTLFSF